MMASTYSDSDSDESSADHSETLREEDLPTDVVFEGDLDDSHSHATLLQQRAAEFLAFIKHECSTTQVTINNLIKGVDGLFQIYNKFVKSKICELTQDEVVPKKDIEVLFNNLSQQTIFEGVQSAFRLEQFKLKNWGALVPHKLVLKWKKKILHGKVYEAPQEFAYFVDFISQLENVLQCRDILDCIDNPKESTSNMFRGAVDGYVFQNHPVRVQHPNAIGIVLYVDDVLPIESLSSYQDQSVRDYSWTIANIHPELRSSVRAINLYALAKTSVAKKCKNKPILQNLIDGLNRLSSDEGVTLNIQGVQRVFHGFLLIVIGDYPALANIGGFKESASFAWRFCRQCFITQKELSSKFEETQVILRSADTHKQQLQVLAGAELDDEEEEVIDETWMTAEEPENPSVKYGINFESPLLQLEHFDVCQQLPQDIMHIFLEGVMEKACRLLLNHAVHEKKLSFKSVNTFLTDFDYGKLQTDKPSPIEPQYLKNGLRQTSSQILMLSSLLPFIVKGHCESTKLSNFILLLKIFSFCLSHEIEMDDIHVLKVMIKDYLTQFSALYPGNFTPKHHFMIHLPTQIVLFSVLTEQWAMRFEAFHQKLKRLTKVLHNAKNLTFSLMMRICGSQDLKLHTNKNDFLRCSVVKVKTKQNLLLSSVPYRELIVACSDFTGDDCEITELSALKWYGSVYNEKDIVLLSQESSDILPSFGSVVQMYCIHNRYIIVHKEIITITFCADLNAYEVECIESGSFKAMDITNNVNLQQAFYIRYGSRDYVLLRQNRRPQFPL